MKTDMNTQVFCNGLNLACVESIISLDENRTKVKMLSGETHPHAKFLRQVRLAASARRRGRRNDAKQVIQAIYGAVPEDYAGHSRAACIEKTLTAFFGGSN